MGAKLASLFGKKAAAGAAGGEAASGLGLMADKTPSFGEALAQNMESKKMESPKDAEKLGTPEKSTKDKLKGVGLSALGGIAESMKNRPVADMSGYNSAMANAQNMAAQRAMQGVNLYGPMGVSDESEKMNIGSPDRDMKDFVDALMKSNYGKPKRKGKKS